MSEQEKITCEIIKDLSDCTVDKLYRMWEKAKSLSISEDRLYFCNKLLGAMISIKTGKHIELA